MASSGGIPRVDRAETAKGVELFCIGGRKDGQYVRVSEDMFRCGSVEFAVRDKEPSMLLFDATPDIRPTFQVERYSVQQFMLIKRRLLFLVADDVPLNAATCRRIIRHLAAMAGMDKVAIRRSFWRRHMFGYLELAALASPVGSNVAICMDRAAECCIRATEGSESDGPALAWRLLSCP
jgi:hypothetical protein